MPGFYPRQIRVGFMVDKVIPDSVFLFSPVTIISPNAPHS